MTLVASTKDTGLTFVNDSFDAERPSETSGLILNLTPLLTMYWSE